MTSAITSGDEDAGRLELLHASRWRQTLWLTRLASALAMLVVVTAITAAVVAASLGPFSFDDIGVGRIFAATFAAAALAAFHAAVTYAVGAAADPELLVGIAVAVAVAGYVASYLLPLSDTLEGFARVAVVLGLGTSRCRRREHRTVDPAARVTAAVIAASTVAVGRRDIRSA
jgi:ABC-2 type transport system permease protein